MPFLTPHLVPRARLARARAPQTRAPAERSAGTGEAAEGTVLVVEDDYFAAWELENGLSEAGFDVVGTTGSAREAVALARSERPDVVVMDIRLRGGGDGIEAALAILAETGIRCIFATAHLDAQTRRRGDAARPWGWIGKPYATPALVALVKDAIARSGKPN